MDSVSSSRSIPLRNLSQRQSISSSPTESESDFQFGRPPRSRNMSSRTSIGGSSGKRGSRPVSWMKKGGFISAKGKERDSDTPEDEIDLLGHPDGDEDGRSVLRGQGEGDGDYDSGWKGAQDGVEVDEAGIAKMKGAQQGLRGSGGGGGGGGSDSKGKTRTIPFNAPDKLRSRFPPNVVQNQKYNVVTFLPLVLFEQFKFFFNLYFLLVALSQLVPALRIGFLATYIVPLAFVLAITIGKEAYDDWKRHQRDVIANSARYQILDPHSSPLLPHASSSSHHVLTASESEHDLEAGRASGPVAIPPVRTIPSSRIRVGDLVILEKNQRVPADMVLLRTSDSSGTCFVRTDQLDGETDWKLRVAVERTQTLAEGDAALLNLEAEVTAEPPGKDIHSFNGTFTLLSPVPTGLPEIPPTPGGPNTDGPVSFPLTAENVLWSNTVLAAGSAVGFVIYTGRETRAVMNTSHPETKVGLLDLEINKLAKILCFVTFSLSVVLVALNGFRGQWFIYIFRFLILFSSIIPISLRVNLDMGKTVYAHQIMNDPDIPDTIVRTSTLPEELGRIEYLLSDKTGTLTQNEMELKKLHMGTMSFGIDTMDEVALQLATAFGSAADADVLLHQRKGSLATGAILATRGRRDMSTRVKDVILALALCHNVTPVSNDDGSITYQASSPDEVAIVRWTESVGLALLSRDRTSITLKGPGDATYAFDILEIFPFTSESKRMGIVTRDRVSGEVTFYQKGADVIMAKIVQQNDWLEEECGNMAREGLRTLVIGRRRLSEESWKDFEQHYHLARISMGDRNEAMAAVVSEHLEKDLELLGVTGVEDKLQEDVKMTLELLRNAGLKIWMLTGDKIETATCIAISSKLVARNQYIHQVAKLKTTDEAKRELEFLQSKPDCCLVIDGESLQLCINHFRHEFIELATQLPAVVACRCSPTQKADVARLIREHTKKRVCCIGDGGNDVSMIQAADVGVGIVGKEGKQASLAADFSITQFSFLTKLLCWHGRNSYQRSAALAQFVIHRGLIISVLQSVFSAVFYFAPIAIYQGWLMALYPTAFTAGPAFSLVWDRDVNEDLALLYPELYLDLVKGRSLSYKTFFSWVMISVYQGGAIMIMSLILFENDLANVVAISFTALVLNELIIIALSITTWHVYMVIAEVLTLLIYAASMALLPQYFDLNFVLSVRFAWKVALIVAVSSLPLYITKILKAHLAPASYAKLRQF